MIWACFGADWKEQAVLRLRAKTLIATLALRILLNQCLSVLSSEACFMASFV